MGRRGSAPCWSTTSRWPGRASRACSAPPGASRWSARPATPSKALAVLDRARRRRGVPRHPHARACPAWRWWSGCPAGLCVVFTTAYDQHALAAFEANAVDYLLKPVEPGAPGPRARSRRALARGPRARRHGRGPRAPGHEPPRGAGARSSSGCPSARATASSSSRSCGSPTSSPATASPTRSRRRPPTSSTTGWPISRRSSIPPSSSASTARRC